MTSENFQYIEFYTHIITSLVGHAGVFCQIVQIMTSNTTTSSLAKHTMSTLFHMNDLGPTCEDDTTSVHFKIADHIFFKCNNH